MTEETSSPADRGSSRRTARKAYLALLGSPVGAHRWYLGHLTAGILYVLAAAGLAAGWFLYRDTIDGRFSQLWLVALVLFVGQVLLDAIAIPRWVAADRDDGPVPLPSLVVMIIAVIGFVVVVPAIIDGLGGILASWFDSERVGSQVAMVIVALLGVPAVLAGYLILVEQTLLHLPVGGQSRLRPWMWLAPALAFLFTFLVYPTFGTFMRSLQDRTGEVFVGLENYRWFFGNHETLLSLRNNLLWLIFFTAITVGVGLLIATLVDRVRYESFAKTIIFVPMAISFVAAAVVWRFMYVWNVPGTPQTGTINALITTLGAPFDAQPVDFLTTRSINNFALILVASWVWVGFSMVILSAGIKAIDNELLEAARVDGASEWQVFRRIMIPLLAPTLAVVTTTMIIFALKTFDIVYTMTSGNYDTQVIAVEMWQQFSFNQYGRASAVAVVLLFAIIPVMAYNIRQFRSQEDIR
jgi:alpha-glucoside transport system permease protein